MRRKLARQSNQPISFTVQANNNKKIETNGATQNISALRISNVLKTKSINVPIFLYRNRIIAF